MALLTLWVSFNDTEHESVARTTRDLLAGLTAPDLGYLVLHVAGLTRGLVHSIAEGAQGTLDLDLALQALARGVHERGAAGLDD